MSILLRDCDGVQNIEFNQYPSGEPLIRGLERTHKYLVGARNGGLKLCVRPESMNEFVGAMFWVDAFSDTFGYVPELILPCVPGARQDRRMGTGGDFLFTAKSVAKMINGRNFPKVTIFDPHSDVISALIDRCIVISASNIFSDFGKHNDWNRFLFRNNVMQITNEGYYRFDGVIAPDAGAAKRASEVAKLFGVPVYQGGKSRDTKTGKISGFWIQDTLPQDGNYLIVDDLCDGGGTFVGLAQEIHRKCEFAELSLYVTHGLFMKGLDELRSYFVHIFASDSVSRVKDLEQRSKLRIFNVCDQIMGEKL